MEPNNQSASEPPQTPAAQSPAEPMPLTPPVQPETAPIAGQSPAASEPVQPSQVIQPQPEAPQQPASPAIPADAAAPAPSVAGPALPSQPAETPAPPAAPQVEPSAGIVSSEPFMAGPQPFHSPATPAGSRKKMLVILVIAVVGLAVLAGGGAAAYTYVFKSLSDKKFNDLALQIKNQEISGAKNYTKVSAYVNQLAPILSLQNSSTINKNAAATLNTNAAAIANLADQGCKSKTSDVTSASIDKQMKGLVLTPSQKKYIADMKQVTADLAATEYSNNGICSDAPALAALIRNFANLLPGLTIFQQSASDSKGPSAAQLNTLQSFTTLNLSDAQVMQTKLPQTAQLFTDMKLLFTDLYYEIQAAQKQDLPNTEKYAGKIGSLANQLDTDTKNSDNEINNLGKTEDDAAKKASFEEINAIDYQINHKSTTANMQIDYTLPAFRIVDTVVSGYYRAHNSSYPYGTSVQSLLGIDQAMKQLQDRNLLKNLTYTSIGKDQSGYSLSATLKDGTKLTEELDPSTLQSI